MYDGKRTMDGILRHRVERSPEQELIRFEDDRLTYERLDREAECVAGALNAWGLEKGDRVAVQLPNCAEFVSVWFGCNRAGIVDVPLNTGLRGALMVHAINQAGCRAVVIAAEWYERLLAIAGEIPAVERVVVVGAGPADRGPWELHTIDELLRSDLPAPRVTIEEWDPSTIIFTSGTTGPSKGVVLNQGYGFETAGAIVSVNEFGERETMFTSFPLFHTNARYASILSCMTIDHGRLIMHQRFSASRFWEICRAENVTGFTFMGAMILILFKQPERDDDADNPVRFGWGAPAPKEVAPHFERRFGITLTEGYGMTETGIVTSNGMRERKWGSCGVTRPEFEMQVQDENGFEVERGVIGEFAVRPREPNVLFSEYIGMPEATLKSFRGLWFHTGDRGRQDEDGYFYFVDRAKDAIRRRGENISSWEVESVLNDHPQVDETAVIGVPSELTEEEVFAVVKLKPGEELTPEALLDYAQVRLPHFAVPRYVRFVPELPKNPQQRIQKFVLREEGIQPGDWDREAVGYEVAR